MKIKNKTVRGLLLGLLLICTLGLTLIGCGNIDTEEPIEETVIEENDAALENVTEETSNSESTDFEGSEEITAVEEVSYVFRNEKLLNSHYEKHGMEMGFDSPEEYEAAASAVVNNPDVLHKTEAEDGDDVYYVEDTNEFVVVSTDGYIRTYFLPNAGKDYFDRQ